jgi:hypothetical protein
LTYIATHQKLIQITLIKIRAIIVRVLSLRVYLQAINMYVVTTLAKTRKEANIRQGATEEARTLLEIIRLGGKRPERALLAA